MSQDRIYENQHDKLEAFSFDEKVAAVFPDMLKRSVPGYALIQEMIAVLTKHYARENTNIYDLGCSLGASCISMLTQVDSESITIYGVDNSEAMIKGAKDNLEKFYQTRKNQCRYQLLLNNIEDIKIQNASIVNLNFTLQFIKPERRDALIKKIFDGLVAGGILILSEKILFEENQDALLNELHHDFKRVNGYSDLEISQKRNALENILIRDTEALHHQRNLEAGFHQSTTWFQCFNFQSIVAIKKA